MLDGAAVVVGAGPSGAATALLLARAGHDVRVFDRARFPRDKACGEGLMPPGVDVLRRLNLLDAVLTTGARPLEGVAYRHMNSGRTAQADFPPPPNDGQSWGLGVRRTSFDSALVDAMRNEPRVSFHEGEPVVGLMRSAGEVVGVRTDGGEQPARVVIAADGLHSRVRNWAGLNMQSRGGGRYGLAGHWRTETRERRSIVVTFAQGCEWYEAPVGPDTLLVSVLGDRHVIGRIAQGYESAARAALPALRNVELLGPPLAAGRFRQRPRSVALGGVFLVGDAAGYEDPTTGEGLAIGLELAERVAEHVGAVLHGEISSDSAAQRYRSDHAQLWRDRRRLIRLALFLAQHQWLSRRAISRAAVDSAALSKLLAINCGYLGFRDLSVRDYLSLVGI